MKQRILSLKNGIEQCLRNFPIESILGVIFFILYIIDDANRSNYYQAYDRNIAQGSSLTVSYENNITNILFLFPALFILVYWCRTYLRKKYLYFASLLTFIPFLFINLNTFMLSIGYGFTLLLSFFVLMINRDSKNNRSFSENVFQTLYHLSMSVLFCILFYLACILIYSSVLFIFSLSDKWKFPQYVGIFNCFLVCPLLFCYFQQKRSESWQPDKFLEIVLNFILSPALIAYTGILYLYFITIAWNQELPKGGIAYMVLAFVITALGGRMAQLIVSKRYYDWFYNHFSFIALPPLIIFWIGTIERIYTYSWTESRVYLFAAGILMTMYMIFLLSKRLGNYRLMLLISSACIAILTFSPYISAKSIGIAAQENRLEHYARTLNIWNESTQSIDFPTLYEAKDSASIENCKQLNGCFDYLRRQLGTEETTKLYGKSFLTYHTPGQKTEHGYAQVTYTEPIAVPEGYRHYSPVTYGSKYAYHFSNSNDTIVQVQEKNTQKVILTFNKEKQFRPYLQSILSWEETSSHDLTPFVVKNDFCILILSTIRYNKAEQTFDCSKGVIFLK